jgi:hypothetical protein
VKGSDSKTWAGVALAIVSVAAYVILRALGDDAAGFTIFATPFIAALLIDARMDKQNTHLAEQTETLATIKRNTNGVLDGRIHDGATVAIRQVLAERDADLAAQAAEAENAGQDDAVPDPYAITT